MIVIAGGQAKALWLTVLSVICKLLMLVWLIPVYGIMGAIAAYLATEFLVSMLPVILVSQYMAAVRLHWRGVIKTFLSAVTALGVSWLLGGYGGAAGGVLAFTLYAVLAVLSGALSPGQAGRIAAGIKSRFAPAETGANA
jgi:O-antigen/teichoic acid export membrane protein